MENKNSKTCIFKILLIGDSGVGKTQILYAIDSAEYNDQFIPTIGVDFKFRNIEIDGKKIKLQVWDTAGEERFLTITTAYYRGAMGIMLVYDITNDKSFENIKNWIRKIKEHARKDTVVMVLGHHFNGTEDKRVVSVERGEDVAREHGYKFREVNYRDRSCIEEAFYALAREIKLKVEGSGFESMELMEPESHEDD